MRILHTMLRVGDLERSIAFYTNVLGMQLLRRKDCPAGNSPCLHRLWRRNRPDRAGTDLQLGRTSTNWGRRSGISRWKCRMCTPLARKCGQRVAKSSAKPGR